MKPICKVFFVEQEESGETAPLEAFSEEMQREALFLMEEAELLFAARSRGQDIAKIERRLNPCVGE